MSDAVATVLGCAVLSACSFHLERLTTDGGSDDAVDADGMAQTTHTRRIDVTATEVVGGPHASFPMLVSRTESWLRDVAHGGDVQSMQGFDILFSADVDGGVPLAHELEAYQGDTGLMRAWIKVPIMTPSTTLYIHYGAPSITTSHEDIAGVWSAGYAGVWHLGSDLRDSANANAGTNGGSIESVGTVGASRSFDGVDDYIDTGTGAGLVDVFAGGGTVEAWCLANTFGESSRGRLFDKGDSATGGMVAGWLLAVDTFNVPSSVLFSQGASGAHGEWNAPAGSFALGAWTHVALVYNSTSLTTAPRLFLDGRPITMTAVVDIPSGVAGSDAGTSLRIGNRMAGDRTFAGSVDEARISTVVRSAGWIETSVRNQRNPILFSTVGPEL